MLVPRSKLFVPAHRLELVDAALSAQPDALCFDLEDAVPPGDKANARASLVRYLRGAKVGCPVWVRVNGCGSGDLVADVLSLQGAPVAVVNLPKVEHPGQLLLLDELLAHIEQAEGTASAIRVIPTIETSTGLRNALAIARASARVLALQIGSGDLTRTTGADPMGAARDMYRSMLALAAAEAGVAALDSTPYGLDDIAAFEADARTAKALGMRGKSCMLASQVAAANAVFSQLS